MDILFKKKKKIKIFVFFFRPKDGIFRKKFFPTKSKSIDINEIEKQLQHQKIPSSSSSSNHYMLPISLFDMDDNYSKKFIFNPRFNSHVTKTQSAPQQQQRQSGVYKPRYEEERSNSNSKVVGIRRSKSWDYYNNSYSM